MGKAFVLSLGSAFNPSLFAALLVMLVSKNAERLMLGYLLGAYLTSITVGLVIVFALPEHSGAASTSRDTISPAIYLALGFLAIVIGAVLATSPHDRASAWQKRRKEKRAHKGPPRWRRALDEGSPRIAFVVGAVLSLPGASYLLALDILHRHELPVATTTLCVIAFCVIQLVLLELPVLGFAVAHDQTVSAVERFRTWITRDALRIATWAAFVIGVLFLLLGLIHLLT